MAIAELAIVFATIGAEQRSELWLELGKGLIELLAVVVLGAAVKLLTDRYRQQQDDAEQAQRAITARDEQNRRFRQDKYDTLVDVTNSLRKVPILIDANRSVKTWSEQMRDVMDAGLKLRAIKHQIYSSRDVAEPPFPHNAALVYLIEVMYHYTDWVTGDFARGKSKLSPLQARAEEASLHEDEVASRKEAVWEAIQALASVSDMRRRITRGERDACSADMERRIAPLLQRADVSTRPALPQPSWMTYEVAEALALELITSATLEPGGRGP